MKHLVPEDISQLLVWEELNNHSGDSLQFPYVKQVNMPAKQCEDCGKVVCDRRIEYKKYNHPTTHWRTNCKSCNLVHNPLTLQFDLTVKEAQAFFKEHLDKKNK